MGEWESGEMGKFENDGGARSAWMRHDVRSTNQIAKAISSSPNEQKFHKTVFELSN